MIIRYLILIMLLAVLTACSVVQATSGPGNKDLSILNPGTQRYLVLAEFGQPLVTERNSAGEKFDIIKFRQGQHGAVKAGKAVAYGAAAIMTLGLSEVITSPVEGAAGKGAEMKLQVVYNDQDKVKLVNVLQDDRWIPVQNVTAAN